MVWTESPAVAVFTEQGATWLGGANYLARSASLADIDNDGDLDLLFETTVGQQLFRNNTNPNGATHASNFSNVTTTMIPSGATTDSWSSAWGDYDGDGKVDVFAGQQNSSPTVGRLLRNTGSGFTDVSVATGLNDPNFAQNVAWADVNNDHHLDMVIGMESTDGLPGTGGGNQIYLQDATHHFTPVGTSVGFQSPVSVKSYGMAIGDYDGDGDLDVYISTCTGSGSGVIANAFYKNMLKETGSLHFTDVSGSNGTANTGQSYGAEFIDMDNDGKLDLFVVGSDGNPTHIYKNMGNVNGNVVFTDVDTITGHALLSNTGSDLNGGAAIDYDNDGKLDLFFHDNNSTASVKLYHNDSTAAHPWTFTEVTTVQGITNTGAGQYDGTWGDIDGDGDLDLINPNNLTLNGSATPERVYINDASTNGNHWLYVKLHGPDWNTTGIGSSLYATVGAVTLRREANTNAGTFNQSDVPVHFGLGSSFLVNYLLVRWSDGTAQGVLNQAANHYIDVFYNPGDYDGDGTVGMGDYNVWRQYYGTSFTAADYIGGAPTWEQRPAQASTTPTEFPNPRLPPCSLLRRFRSLAGAADPRNSLNA